MKFPIRDRQGRLKKYPADFVNLMAWHPKFMEARKIAQVLLEGPMHLSEINYRESEFPGRRYPLWQLYFFINGQEYGVVVPDESEKLRFQRGPVEVAESIERYILAEVQQERRKGFR